MPEAATQRQLITLAALTGEDWQDRNLTKDEASLLIRQYTDNPQPNIANDNQDGRTQTEPPESQDAPQPVAAPTGNPDDVLLAALRESVESVARRMGLDLPAGTEAVDETIRNIVGVPRDVHITIPPTHPDQDTITSIAKNTHRNFPTLAMLVSDRQHVMLIGPTGGGKTTAAMHAAHACVNSQGEPFAFYAKACTMTDTSSDWFGYNSAHGYEPSLFRKAYEYGGLFVAEEIDAGNPSITTGIHMAVENGVAAFPDRMIDMHPDFRFVSTANTWGYGMDRQYVGRNPLDAATIDRFWQLDWDYDETLERHLAITAALGINPNFESEANEWVTYVQRIRKHVYEAREQLVISPRASIKGARALAIGSIPRGNIERMLLWRNTKDSVRARLLQTGRS